jgi:hypothetical protein
MPHLFRRAAVLIVAALAGGSAGRTRLVEAAPTPLTVALTAARERPTLEAPGESTYHRPDKLRLRVTRSLPPAPATPGLRPALAAAPPLLPPAEPHARPDRGPGVRSRPPPLS